MLACGYKCTISWELILPECQQIKGCNVTMECNWDAIFKFLDKIR